jgi:hypothetical protein
MPQYSTTKAATINKSAWKLKEQLPPNYMEISGIYVAAHKYITEKIFLHSTLFV